VQILRTDILRSRVRALLLRAQRTGDPAHGGGAELRSGIAAALRAGGLEAHELDNRIYVLPGALSARSVPDTLPGWCP